MDLTTIIVPLACLVVGCAGGYLIFRYVLNGKYKAMVEQAEKEAEKTAEVLKEKKLLEVKEKFLNKKTELEKEVQQRNQKIQQGENRLKQREISLNQRQEDLSRRKQEVDQMQQRIDNEKKMLQNKQAELEKMQSQEREKLEELSGLSAEEAKNRLIESLKDEAKTDAASYINEIIDEAKLNANQQAKKIVIQTIQRVAVSSGSGKSMIKTALEKKADVIVTGDIDYHSGIDSVAQGLAVIDAGHYGTEYCFITYMKQELEKMFPDMEVGAAAVRHPYQVM